MDERRNLRIPFSVGVFAAVAAVSGLSLAGWAALPEHHAVVAAGMIGAAAGCAVLLRAQLRSEIRALQKRIHSLPQMAPGEVSGGEFSDLEHSVEVTAQRLHKRLSNAHSERMQLESVLDSMQDAVIAVDAAGRIEWANQSMQRLISGASGQNRVRVGHALVQTIRDPEVLECVKSALAGQQTCEGRSTTMVPGKFLQVSASPTPSGGAVAVLHDITRIEQVERTQRDFVANVSHELRTPLTSITGYVETLLDHETALSPQATDFLSTILKNATRMNRLTEDLLTLARVESQASDLHRVAIRADLLVEDAVESMRGLVQDEDAELEVGATTGSEVLVDVDSMLQVLGNLIENGIKYGRARNATHSRVVVSARDVSGPVETVEFTVRDFGQGIASEHLERIFERFYRVDKARSRESGGTGLGLAIARHVVTAQGGTIRAESELNGGSRFIVRFPKLLSTPGAGALAAGTTSEL